MEEQREGKTTMSQMYFFFPYDTLNRSQLYQSGARKKTPQRNLRKLAASPSSKNGTEVPHSVAQKQNISLEFYMV